MIIIPAIDIMNGQCVRLSQGDFSKQKVYSKNPLDVARAFEEAGFTYLHVVDLDGAKAGKVVHWDIVESIAAKTKLNIDFGGGIKTEAEVLRLFDFEIKVNLGSVAYQEQELVKEWLNWFGNDRIILSADSKNEMLAVAGWQNNTTLSVIDFIQEFVTWGLQFATCTDIAKDGMMAGPNVDLYKKILSAFPSLKLIASGGARSLQDLELLKSAGCYGCIIGKALYEGSLSQEALVEFQS